MKQEETDMVVSDVVDLTSSLRLSSVDGEELGKERQMLVVGRWLDRAGWALERLEDEPMGARLAAELLVTWQALYRLADDAVGQDDAERVQLREGLERVVCARREELVKLAPEAFCFAQWRDALAEYVTQVGAAPRRWSQGQMLRAIELIEGLDDALLCEAALERLEATQQLSMFLEQLQQAVEAARDVSPSLIPAQALIQATCWTLEPTMQHATGSYALWLNLVEACAAWGCFEALVVLGALAAREQPDG